MSKIVENLDCMGWCDLNLYINKHVSDPRYSKEVAYARLVRDAQDNRERGFVLEALKLERQADRIYDGLPAQERW